MTAIKKAVEYYKGVWPFDSEDTIGIECGVYHSVFIKNSQLKTVCNKQQFEDYVREAKMEKQYKTVSVTDMDIWDLGKAVAGGGEYYCEGYQVTFSEVDGTLQTKGLNQYGVYLGVIGNQITTRQPLPWYEVEGLHFPCIGKVGALGVVRVFLDIDGDQIQDDSGEWRPVHPVQLLTVEEIDELKKAALYGVEL